MAKRPFCDPQRDRPCDPPIYWPELLGLLAIFALFAGIGLYALAKLAGWAE